MRQTTVLIAQLATAGGFRAPLAHVADHVLRDLARSLQEQGISRRVSADMFGMALRAYVRKVQRPGESTTFRGRSLRESILAFVGERGLVTRREVRERFDRDEETLVRGVLRDLVESGLVFSSGLGDGAVFGSGYRRDSTRRREVEKHNCSSVLLVFPPSCFACL